MTQTDVIRLAREVGGTPYTNRHYPDQMAMVFSNGKLLAFADRVIADFLQRTDQYVTNDASRDEVIQQAVLAERERILAIAYDIVRPIDESAWIAIKAHVRNGK